VAYAAVVFDLFGTLVPNYDWVVYDDLERRIAARLGMSQAELHTRWSQTFVARSTGGYSTLADNFAAVCGISPPALYPAAVYEAEQWRIAVAKTLLVPLPEDVQLLTRLRAAGLRVGIVSNCSPEVPTLWRQSALASPVDAAIFSNEVGLMKPDPAIYRAVCAALGVEPQRCLYVGDGEHQELTGAADVGMTAILLRRAERDVQLHDPEADAWPGVVITEIPQLWSLLERSLPPSAH
jgi:putative hydrolase of the HAD superfamily